MIIDSRRARSPIARRVPRPADLAPLLRLRRPVWNPTERRLAAALTIEDLRRIARRRTPRAVFDYTDGGAEEELTLRRARAALERIELEPRVLTDVEAVDPSAEILGRPAALPLVLAPTGYTRMMQHEGEVAVVRAAAAAGLPYTLSTMGTRSIEQVAAAGPDVDRWFQLYLWRDRDASRDLISRAGAAGYRTLMLTVDTPIGGLRLRDVRNGLTIPPALTLKKHGIGTRVPQVGHRYCSIFQKLE